MTVEDRVGERAPVALPAPLRHAPRIDWPAPKRRQRHCPLAAAPRLPGPAEVHPVAIELTVYALASLPEALASCTLTVQAQRRFPSVREVDGSHNANPSRGQPRSR